MRPGTSQTALVCAAVLCAALALWTTWTGEDAGRRARRLVGGAEPDGPGRFPWPLSWAEPARRLRRLRDRRLRDRWRAGRRADRGADAGDAGATPVVRWWHDLRSPRGEPRERTRDGRRTPRPAWWPMPWAGPETAALPAGVLVGVLTRSPLPALAGAAAVPLVRRVLRRRAARAASELRVAAVGTLCASVAADLRAGRPAHPALADALESAGWAASPDLGEAARLLLSAARFGGDVPEALRAAARLQEGTHGLAAAAACWQVAVDGGAGLADGLDRVAAALRAEADQRDDLRAQLAGPRSTAVLLALLPVFGLVLGTGLGAHPWRVLLHTRAGLLCLVTGGLLEWAGLAWTARIIRGAEGGPLRKAAPARAPEREPS
jgi:Flp pilus assembly protein TadB